MKEGIDRGVAHSTYYVTKQPLAHVIQKQYFYHVLLTS